MDKGTSQKVVVQEIKDQEIVNNNGTVGYYKKFVPSVNK